MIDYSSQFILAKLREDLNIKDKLAVYKCSLITSPVIIGIINPRIYVPMCETDTDLLEMMLRHELVHYKRKDILYKFIILIACCMHWFNPFVWLMNKQAQQDIEIACDEDVIRNQNQDFRRLYSESIMSVVKYSRIKNLAFSTGFANDKRTLAARFRKIFDYTVKRGGKPVLLVILSVCILSSGFVACSTKLKEFEIPQQAMEFMQFYCNYRNDDNFFERHGYDLGFAYLYENNTLNEKYINSYYNNGEASSYRLPIKNLMDVYQFIMADKMPAEWWNDVPELSASSWAADYNYMNSPFVLGLKEVEKNDSKTFTATFSRTRDGIPEDDIRFVMEKQNIDYVPEDLTSQFTEGEEIWRIKSVEVIEGSWQPESEMIFEIDSVEDFLLFTKDYNENGYMRVNYKYILNADIDFGGMELTPVGCTKQSLGFAAEFDGQGHTLSNFKITDIDSYDNYYANSAGLFASVFSSDITNASSAVIKNLNIENATVQIYNENGGNRLVGTGILVGSANGAHISNCHVSGNVEGFAAVGGLAGYVSSSTVDNCTADVTVKACQEAGSLAGLVSYSYIDNCMGEGVSIGIRDPEATIHDVTTPYRIGGIMGTVIGSNIMKCHCDTTLQIMSNARTIGSFTATCESSVFTNNSYNPDKINNWGLVGYYHDNYDRTYEIRPSDNDTGVYSPH